MGLLAQIILPQYFLAALVLGTLWSLWHRPEPTVLVKHPTPFNSQEVTYKDGAGNCYRYEPRQRQCPADPKAAKRFTLV